MLVVMVGVLAIGLGFVFSFVGALHDPQPHDVRVAVVAPRPEARAAITHLNGLPGGPLRAVAVHDERAAREQVRDGDEAGALIVDPSGQADRLLVASGGGAALTMTVEQVMSEVEAAQHRSVSSTDLAPLQSGDFRGTTGFFMVIGWLLAGYVLAAVLGVLTGGHAATVRSVAARLLLLVPYAIVAGLGGMLIVDTLLGALTGHFLALAGLGALLVFVGAAFTIALQALLGVLGTAVAMVLLVVIGNPSSGGVYQLPLLPGFWRTIGDALPNGAAVQAARHIAYFGSHGVAAHLVILGAYAVGAIAAAVTLTALRSRRARSHAPAAPQMRQVGAAAA